MELNKSQTYKNLAISFASESQARTRYAFLEYGARKEGYSAMSELIKKVRDNEFQHARMFYTFIQKSSNSTIENIDICGGFPFKEKWNLLDNLKFANENETSETSNIYPSFAKVAREEGFDDIARLFENIAKVEKCHSMLFKQLYTQMKDGTMYKKPNPVKWKCADCGYEETAKEAWQYCPICDAKQGAVMLKIEDEA